MGYYHLDLDSLAEYTGISIEDLKKKSYSDLEKMVTDMENDKIMERNNRNAQDAEFKRLVLKYFEPLDLFRSWFDDKEIVLACALTGITEMSLCQKYIVEPGAKCHYPNGEYIRTSNESVPQYDRSGRELMERAIKKMDVYRIANQYQSNYHRKPIEHLLYERYPELAKFGFSIYGVRGYEKDYEIYPKNGIYTSVAALMSGDIDWIIFRNREYCAFYNNGRYSSDECEKAFRTKNAKKMFDVIHEIGRQEQRAGHLPIKRREDGKYIHIGGLEEMEVSASGNIMILAEPEDRYDIHKKRKFKLDCATPYTVECLINEYLEMTSSGSVSIHVYHNTDYLGEYGINISTGRGGHLTSEELTLNGIDCSRYIVNNTFGWVGTGVVDLTLRIECPEIGRKAE